MICYWISDLIFKVKSKLESGQKSDIAAKRPLRMWHCWKWIDFCLQRHAHENQNWNSKSKFDLCSGNHTAYRVSIPKKKQYGCQADILKVTSLKSVDFYPYTQVLCTWSFELIFKTGLKLEPRNRTIQYSRQATILKVTKLKINWRLPMATINMHMKFKNVIPKQTPNTLRKLCLLQNAEPKNLIWPPGGHFENDITEIQ